MAFLTVTFVFATAAVMASFTPPTSTMKLSFSFSSSSGTEIILVRTGTTLALFAFAGSARASVGGDSPKETLSTAASAVVFRAAFPDMLSRTACTSTMKEAGGSLLVTGPDSRNSRTGTAPTPGAGMADATRFTATFPESSSSESHPKLPPLFLFSPTTFSAGALATTSFNTARLRFRFCTHTGANVTCSS